MKTTKIIIAMISVLLVLSVSASALDMGQWLGVFVFGNQQGSTGRAALLTNNIVTAGPTVTVSGSTINVDVTISGGVDGLMEVQVLPHGATMQSLFNTIGPQDTCDPAFPLNVHKTFTFGTAEIKSNRLQFSIPNVPNGERDIWLVSASKCYSEAPGTNREISPYPKGIMVKTVTIGNVVQCPVQCVAGCSATDPTNCLPRGCLYNEPTCPADTHCVSPNNVCTQNTGCQYGTVACLPPTPNCVNNVCVASNVPPPTPTCSDRVQNQGETGIDCGGPCTACPTCTDGVKNQGELGIDCGGPCAKVCGTPGNTNYSEVPNSASVSVDGTSINAHTTIKLENQAMLGKSLLVEMQVVNANYSASGTFGGAMAVLNQVSEQKACDPKYPAIYQGSIDTPWAAAVHRTVTFVSGGPATQQLDFNVTGLAAGTYNVYFISVDQCYGTTGNTKLDPYYFGVNKGTFTVNAACPIIQPTVGAACTNQAGDAGSYQANTDSNGCTIVTCFVSGEDHGKCVTAGGVLCTEAQYCDGTGVTGGGPVIAGGPLCCKGSCKELNGSCDYSNENKTCTASGNIEGVYVKGSVNGTDGCYPLDCITLNSTSICASTYNVCSNNQTTICMKDHAANITACPNGCNANLTGCADTSTTDTTTVIVIAALALVALLIIVIVRRRS